jgi:hypothetical protein
MNRESDSNKMGENDLQPSKHEVQFELDDKRNTSEPI